MKFNDLSAMLLELTYDQMMELANQLNANGMTLLSGSEHGYGPTGIASCLNAWAKKDQEEGEEEC